MTKLSNIIEDFNGSIIKTESFDTIKEAKKGAKAMMKEYTLIRHAGHVVNYSDRFELFTNY